MILEFLLDNSLFKYLSLFNMSSWLWSLSSSLWLRVVYILIKEDQERGPASAEEEESKPVEM